MNKIAYSLFIAFVASIATLFLVYSLGGSNDQTTSARVITLDELAQHNTAQNCWKEIGGRVYDITAYIPNHPSEIDALVAWCGKPASEAFSSDAAGHGHSASATRMLASMQVGVLAGAALADIPEPTKSALAPSHADGGLQVRGGYRDGSYYAETQPDGRGWIGLLEITIHGGYVVGAHYDEVQRNARGGVTNSKLLDYSYAGRWRAVSGVSQLSAFPGYVARLISTGDAGTVDAFSGATRSYDNFHTLAVLLLQEAQ